MDHGGKSARFPPKGLKRDIGRRVSILVIGLTFMVFLGIAEHENLQLEENVF